MRCASCTRRSSKAGRSPERLVLHQQPAISYQLSAMTMMTVLDRFLRYVRYDTQSDEQSKTYPSTEKQLVLLRDLAAELRDLGLADAAVDEHGYVMATIPATTAKARVPTVGF